MGQLRKRKIIRKIHTPSLSPRELAVYETTGLFFIIGDN